MRSADVGKTIDRVLTTHPLQTVIKLFFVANGSESFRVHCFACRRSPEVILFSGTFHLLQDPGYRVWSLASHTKRSVSAGTWYRRLFFYFIFTGTGEIFTGKNRLAETIFYCLLLMKMLCVTMFTTCLEFGSNTWKRSAWLSPGCSHGVRVHCMCVQISSLYVRWCVTSTLCCHCWMFSFSAALPLQSYLSRVYMVPLCGRADLYAAKLVSYRSIFLHEIGGISQLAGCLLQCLPSYLSNVHVNSWIWCIGVNINCEERYFCFDLARTHARTHTHTHIHTHGWEGHGGWWEGRW